MNLTRYDDLEMFAAVAEPHLERHEAAHSLPLGILGTLRVDRTRFGAELYLATVTEGERVVAVAMRTPPYNLILSLVEPAVAVPPALALVARDAYGCFAALPGVVGPVPLGRHFAEEWRRVTGHDFTLGMRERAYVLETVTPVSGVAGGMRRATTADLALLAQWLQAFDAEALGGREFSGRDPMRWAEQTLAAPERGVYLWEDAHDAVVSLVGHGSPTRHGMRIGPVYAPSEQRGHGYASALTAAVSQQLLDSGRRCVFLFTDLANPTSNKIYQRIGYRPVCDIEVYTMAQP